MAIQLGFDLLTGLFVDTTIFNVSWILNLVLTFFTLLVITRDSSKWKELAFPVMFAWYLAGIPPNILALIVSGVVFIIDALSVESIRSVMRAVTQQRRIIRREVKKSELKQTRGLLKTISKDILPSSFKVKRQEYTKPPKYDLRDLIRRERRKKK